MVSEETRSKKQRNEECIINSLPEELIEQIFVRLPVSTLLSCRGVCRQWRNIIRDPQFVTSHLQHAPHCALIFFPQESVSGKRYPADAILIDKDLSRSTYAVPAIGPDDLLCGSCNGLLCLYTKTSMIKIANLATGECLHLQKPAKNLKGDHFTCYSFGFHPVTKEYKIAHFLGDCTERRPHNKDKFSLIQVYTLGDQKWKDVRTPEALSLNCVKNSGVVSVDGAMYWLAEDAAASWEHALMSFDLSEESFARIQLPTAVLEDCAGGAPRRHWMTEIDGKVCIATAQVSRYLPRVLVGKLQIWTLDNKVEQTWSQKYSIQYSPHYVPGPHFVHGNRILTQRRDGNLHSCELLGENIEMKSSNMVKLFDFSPRKPDRMQSYICVKSLVRLDIYKKAGIVRRPKQKKCWELKKWEPWERALREVGEMWSNIHKMEDDETAFVHNMSVGINELLQIISDEVVRQRIGMEINQILQHIPHFLDQQPRSIRRLNWVEQKRDIEKLHARMDKFNDIIKASTQARDSIFSTISHILDQEGTSSSGAGRSSHNQSDVDDTKT